MSSFLVQEFYSRENWLTGEIVGGAEIHQIIAPQAVNQILEIALLLVVVQLAVVELVPMGNADLTLALVARTSVALWQDSVE